MPRVVREIELGFPMHVTQRGNNRQNIFRDEEDKELPINPVGRPDFSRDSVKRKRKRVLPQSGTPTAAVLWAVSAQDQISEILSPSI